MPHKWTPREIRLVTEYVLKRWPDKRAMFRVRLGNLPNILHPTARYADAVVVDEPDVYLIEAKLENGLRAIGQLILYRKLLKETPGFEKYADEHIKSLLVVGKVEKDLIETATSMGIEVDVFQPPWVLPFLESLITKRRRVPFFEFPSELKAEEEAET